MEVSQSKSVVSASSPALGADLIAKRKPHGIKHTLKVQSLGEGLAAGVRRNAMVLNARLKTFRKKQPMYITLRRIGADAARLMGTGGVAALVHGEGSFGVAPTMPMAQRRCVNAAAAPEGGLGGQELGFRDDDSRRVQERQGGPGL